MARLVRLALWATLAGCRGELCAEGPRPDVADILVQDLFLGRDPLAAPSTEPSSLEKGMTHVSGKDIDMVLQQAVQPVNFWLELGSYEGGSAILTAKRLILAGINASVIAVDTFLGDDRVLWLQKPEVRRNLLQPDGTIKLFERFKANVRQSGVQQCVLPLPATSVVALKVVESLAQRQTIPWPQVIYLDSAHAEDETLLELRLAWQALAPGGILFGDDWVMGSATSDQEIVQVQVLQFAAEIEEQLDDTLGEQAWPARTLGRARKGLFVSYNSVQWFMRKLRSGRTPTAQPKETANSLGWSCWAEGFSAKECCDEVQHGPGGKTACWDLVYTFERCCR
mmetsp:Transcript_66856/g.157523  ORF Transcript_66856/g.157523 Transcript_66856/m.157523 type:complete len:339 (-) Transcript_66856:46-1062(-)